MNEPEKPGPASQGPSLSSYGFVFPRSGLATDEEQAARIAGAIGYPVALKMVSSDIMHKTDVGGVELDVGSDDEVRRACRRIRESVASRAPHARVDGIRVEEMVSRGIEVIIGLKDDAQFGPVIMFGLGGIFTELLDDVSLRVLPIEEIDAREMLSEIRGAGILRGYRGRPAVSEDMLVRLLLQAGALAADLGSDLGSVDLNPVAVWGDEHRVLDFKSSPPVDRKAAHRRDVDTRHLETFFKARSVAVIGASATPGKIGYAVLESLAKHEYGGRVYPVNPGRDCILGLPAYPSLSAIPERVDLVVCTVDLALVPGLMKECATLGTHNLVVVSGGGKELGGERAAVEAEIRRLARELDVRVVGPNCIGVFDGRTRLDTFFQPQERMIRPPAGPVAMMSQSGTVGIAFMEDMAAVGMSSFVSYGNRADVDEADLLTYLAEDPDTRVIALYVEGFENGRGFLEAARRAAARKPVVIFKSGRTDSAGKAALTHTGFLAGSYKVAEAAFRQAGLIAVDSYEELVAVSKALAMQPVAAGPRVAMIGNGIGTTVQALDILSQYGLQLATLSPDTLRGLTNVYPSFYVIQNPLDVTGSGSSADYDVGIQALLADPGVDIVMPWMVFQDVPLDDDIPEKLGRLNRETDKPIICGATGGPFTARMSALIEAEGVPVFSAVRDWVAAARGLALAGKIGL
jgi:3-hydroxypropionyl-CoA synthetase (ADP-forming)